MSACGLHEILIASEDMSGCALMLSAIVERMVNGFVVLGGRSVLINMRERGSELLLSADDISEDMFAGKRAARFSVSTAFRNPDKVPHEAEISLCSGDEYYGRVRFRCAAFSGIIPEERADAVLLVVGENGAEHDLRLPEGAGTAAAILCGRPPEAAGTAAECPEGLREAIGGRRCFIGRYNPFGFVNGVQHSPDCAEPYGVEELFWRVVRFAAESRYEYLERVICVSRRTIARRGGLFSRRSIRNCMELELARGEYSAAVRDIYSSERLLELTRGYTEEKNEA